MAKGPEAKFQDKVMKELRKLPNSWFYKTHDMVTVGVPDIIGCVNKRFVALELKAPKGKPTPIQLHTLDKIRIGGGVARIVYPHEWPSVYETLKELAGSLI